VGAISRSGSSPRPWWQRYGNSSGHCALRPRRLLLRFCGSIWIRIAPPDHVPPLRPVAGLSAPLSSLLHFQGWTRPAPCLRRPALMHVAKFPAAVDEPGNRCLRLRLKRRGAWRGGLTLWMRFRKSLVSTFQTGRCSSFRLVFQRAPPQQGDRSEVQLEKTGVGKKNKTEQKTEQVFVGADDPNVAEGNAVSDQA
jgi:hypothetical protein